MVVSVTRMRHSDVCLHCRSLMTEAHLPGKLHHVMQSRNQFLDLKSHIVSSGVLYHSQLHHKRICGVQKTKLCVSEVVVSFQVRCPIYGPKRMQCVLQSPILMRGQRCLPEHTIPVRYSMEWAASLAGLTGCQQPAQLHRQSMGQYMMRQPHHIFCFHATRVAISILCCAHS